MLLVICYILFDNIGNESLYSVFIRCQMKILCNECIWSRVFEKGTITEGFAGLRIVLARKEVRRLNNHNNPESIGDASESGVKIGYSSMFMSSYICIKGAAYIRACSRNHLMLKTMTQTLTPLFSFLSCSTSIIIYMANLPAILARDLCADDPLLVVPIKMGLVHRIIVSMSNFGLAQCK